MRHSKILISVVLITTVMLFAGGCGKQGEPVNAEPANAVEEDIPDDRIAGKDTSAETPSPTAAPAQTAGPTAAPAQTAGPTAAPAQTAGPTATPAPTAKPTAEPAAAPAQTTEPAKTPKPAAATAQPAPAPAQTTYAYTCSTCGFQSNDPQAIIAHDMQESQQTPAQPAQPVHEHNYIEAGGILVCACGDWKVHEHVWKERTVTREQWVVVPCPIIAWNNICDCGYETTDVYAMESHLDASDSCWGYSIVPVFAEDESHMETVTVTEMYCDCGAVQ